MKISKSLLIITAIFFSLNVNATDIAETFQMLDSDNDGKITQSEANADSVLAVTFKKWDKDKNGLLSKDEFSAYKNNV